MEYPGPPVQQEQQDPRDPRVAQPARQDPWVRLVQLVLRGLQA